MFARVLAGRFQDTIEDCASHATVRGAKYMGGILGVDERIVQALSAYEFKNNAFGGMISAGRTRAPSSATTTR